MADITDVTNALKAILSVLPDVDEVSTDNYTPTITTRKTALLIVPYEQSGAMGYASLNGGASLVHAHRISCEFWCKVDAGDKKLAVQRARDLCLQALRLIAANPRLNGTVNRVGSALLGQSGVIGQYDILPRYEERGQIPYIVARLFVPIEMYEIAPSQ